MTAGLVFATFIAAVFTLGAYTIVAPWWRTRSGRAYFGLFAALTLIAGHFVLESIIGQAPPWVETALVAVVLAAVLWNAYTIISKQIRAWRRDYPPRRIDRKEET